MSQANIPDITPNVSITTDDSVNLILSSIGLEELSLSHILNAEAEKVQYSLGTLETASGAQEMPDIIRMNVSANKMVKDTIKSNILLGLKLSDTIDFDEQRRTFKVSANDDFISVIENAPDNSTITLVAGVYEFPQGFEVTKNLTLKGVVSSDNTPQTTIAVKDGETISVKGNLNLSGFAIDETNPIGIPAIALTSENATLNLSKITANIEGSGNANSFDGTQTFIQVANVPGSEAGGSPSKANISIKDSKLVFDGDYARAISYAGGTGGNLAISNVSIEYNTAKVNSTYSKAIAVMQDSDETLNITIDSSSISGPYYPVYIRGTQGEVNLTISNTYLSGYCAVYFFDLYNSTVNINKSELNGVNLYAGQSSNDFFTVVLNNVDNSTININDTILKSTMTNTAYQYVLGTAGTVNNSVVNLLGSTSVVVSSTETLGDDYVCFDGLNEKQVIIDETVSFDPIDINKFS